MKNTSNILKHLQPFPLELGDRLPGIEIAYHTYGKLNSERSNVIWICHALTANSNPMEWWPGLVGDEKIFDPKKHFIVCANILGSCYGTTGPLSVNPDTGRPWYRQFPKITIRDMISTYEILRKHLGIFKIQTIIGGSMGGHQALEWAIRKPALFENLILLATSASLSPWTIAFNQSQRLAIEADCTFNEGWQGGGAAGLKAARSIALLSYRNGIAYNLTQAEADPSKTGCFRAVSYQNYQGDKLVRRFNAWSYHLLTRAMDTHNVGRNRESIESALQKIRALTLVVGITSDILFPTDELKFIHENIRNSVYREINSPYGHDGFLTEFEQLSNIIHQFNQINKHETTA
nr:homoserine O-acetyltransferase [Bacteroidota bacterium]